VEIKSAVMVLEIETFFL